MPTNQSFDRYQLKMTTKILFTLAVAFLVVLLRKKWHRRNPKFKPSAVSRTFSLNPRNKKCLGYCQIEFLETPIIIRERMWMVSFYGRVVKCTCFIRSLNWNQIGLLMVNVGGKRRWLPPSECLIFMVKRYLAEEVGCRRPRTPSASS